MNIVGRIKFPNTPETSGLYIKCDEDVFINYQEGCKEISILRGSIVSLNTFFNSFYEKLYARYTELSSLYYLLKLKGNFKISIYREFDGRESRKLIYEENFEKCDLSDYVKILLPTFSPDEELGRIYLEIKCLSEDGLFIEGLLATTQEKIREVSLGIISCTFRKEAYIIKTVNTVIQDNLLKEKKIKFFVVDNGKTLKEDELNDPIVQLIPNRNLGGSGGFARGLFEALQEDAYTHFLFMDDDIELDSESIYRLFTLYEYAKHDFAVSGGWLDLVKKHLLYEAGAFYGEKNDSRGCKPFSVHPLKRNLDLQNPTVLNQLLLEEDLDYGGFWFFSCSKEIVEKIGLIMPFFIQRDDVEFCLRVKNYAGKQIIVFPPISVWHEPSYAISKQPTWLTYYVWRNNLITSCIHRSLEYVDAIKHIIKNLIIQLFFYNYGNAAMIVKAFEDCMQGPVFLQSSDSEALHFQILELSKHYQNQTPCCDGYLLEQFYQKPPASSLKTIISILTLNGHLLPSFLISNSEALIIAAPGRSKEWLKAFGKKKILLYQEEKNAFSQYELNQWAGLKLLSKFLTIAIIGVIKWPFISAQWKTTSKELVSFKFWQGYFGLSQ